MSHSHEKLKLPPVFSKWEDGNYERKHLFVQFLSGTTRSSFKEEPKVIKGAHNHLRLLLDPSTLLFDPERLFDHPEFEHALIQFELKHSAYNRGVNKRTKEKNEPTFLVETSLSSYELTPLHISGHPSWIHIWLSEIDADNKKTGANTFIMMFHFIIPKKAPTFTVKKKNEKRKSPTRRRLGF